MKRTCKKIVAVLLTIVLCLTVQNVTWQEKVFAATNDIETCDMSNFNSWKSGAYSGKTASYESNASKICLKEYKTVQKNTKYFSDLKENSTYRMEVYELNQSKKVVATHDMRARDNFITRKDTAYLAVNLYNWRRAKATFSEYKTAFEKGEPLAIISEEKLAGMVKEKDEPLASCNMKDIRNWMSGDYEWRTGKYQRFSCRICLKGYKTVEKNTKFTAKVKSKSVYHILVRELDAEKNFICSHDLTDGKSFVTTNKTAFLAIGVYDPRSNGRDFKYFENIFQNGEEIYLESEKKPSVNPSKNQDHSIEGCDLSDINNWKCGSYFYTGIYEYLPFRICLKEHKTVQKNMTYTVGIQNTPEMYRMLIRELDKDKKFLATHNLKNKDKVKLLKNTEYVAIILINPNSCSIRFPDYEKLFKNGAKISLTPENYSSWQGSMNKPSNKAYGGVSVAPSVKPSVAPSVKPSVASSVKVSTAPSVKPSAAPSVKASVAPSVKASVAPSVKPSAVSSGKLSTVSSVKPSAAPSVKASTAPSVKPSAAPSVKPSVAPSVKPSAVPSVKASTAPSVKPSTVQTDTSIEAFKAEVKQMVITGDMTTHDISRYKLKYQKLDAAWNELKASDEEVKLAKMCYGAMFLHTEQNSSGICEKLSLTNADAGFPQRYARAKAKTNEILNYIYRHPEMTNLDKVIYIHDYIALNTKKTSDSSFLVHAGGCVLGEGKGVCEAYAEATSYLLNKLGIECIMANSTKMNHCWNLVKLDGEWYHMDVIWDDLEDKGVNRQFFLWNDEQFKNHKHNNWWFFDASKPNTLYLSTSEKYNNWFVHDITGNMYYHGGYWYYLKDNNVMKAKSDGSYNQVYVDGTKEGKTLRLEDYVPEK